MKQSGVLPSKQLIKRLTLFISLFIYSFVLVSCGIVTKKDIASTDAATNKHQVTPVSTSFEQHGFLNLEDLNNLKQDGGKAVAKLEGTIAKSPTLKPQVLVGSSRVELKLLIISATGNPSERDGSDPVLDGISYFAEQIGIPYDIMIATSEQLTESRLVAANGDGRYQAIILTDGSLNFNNAGTFESAFDQSEWNLLWEYESKFNVRQLTMNVFPGTFPEDLGLRQTSSVSSTADVPLDIGITTSGQAIFESLKSSAVIPVTNAFINLASVCSEDPNLACPTGVTTTPILRTSTTNEIVGVVSNIVDANGNRDVITLTMGHNYFLNHTALISYDLLKWVTQGVFIGAREMYLQLDIDDWYQTSAIWDPATNTNIPDQFRLSGSDVLSARDQLAELRSRFSVAPDLNFSNAVVSFPADPTASISCSQGATLSEATLCVKDDFDWVSHTYTERPMNFESPGYNNAADIFYNANDPTINSFINGFTCDDSSIASFSPTSIGEEIATKEIICNLQKLQQVGISVDPRSIITSAHSGLGHYNPDPLSSAFIDNGLTNSSSGTLRAMTETGIRYMGANHSVESHRGICGVCGRQHPDYPQIFLIPRYPTFIFFNAIQPIEIESEFNFLFGPTGQFVDGFGNPFFDRDLSYDEIIDLDAQVTLRHITSLQPYMHFFHQANLHNYTGGNPGRSLIYDWLEAFLELYSSFYDLPLITLDWTDQAENIEQRTSFFQSGTTGVWDRAVGQVTVTSANGGSVYVTNSGFTNVNTSSYGSDVIQKFSLSAGQSKSSASTGPTSPNLLENGSFENNQVAWVTCGSGQTSIVGDTTDGSGAMNLSGVGGGACLFQEADIVPGSTYTLTCDAKRNDNSVWSSMSLNFTNADYTVEFAGDSTGIFGSTYTSNTLTATAPPGAARATVGFYSEDNVTFDNCILSGEGGSTPDPVTNLLSNGGFENDLSNWSSCGGTTIIVSDAASGTKAAQLGSSAGVCLFQEVVVSAGQTLSLSCEAKRNEASIFASLSVGVNNASYTEILASQATEIIGNSYQEYTLSVVVPTGGTSAAVTFYSQDSATYDDCVLSSQ